MRNERENQVSIPQTVNANSIYLWLVDMDLNPREVDIRNLEKVEGDLSSYKRGLGKVIEEGVPVWNEVTQMLIRHTAHAGSSYVIPPERRILIAQLSPFFTTKSITKCFNVYNEISCRRITAEVAAAITYVLGKTNEFIPWDSLDEYGKEQLIKFVYLEKERLSLGPVLVRKDVRKVLNDSPALDDILTRQLQDGAVSFYLDELGFETMPRDFNTDFATFAKTGQEDRRNGVYKWTRNASFMKWLNSKSCVNCNGVALPPLVETIALKAFNYELSPNGHNSELAGHVRNFLRYIMISDSRRQSPASFYNGLRNGQIPDSTFKFVELAIEGGNYHLGTEEISRILVVSESTARAAYHAGVFLVDYLLSTHSKEIDNASFLQSLSPCPTYRGYIAYKGIVKGITNETAEFCKG